jgi:hypothetical protein
VSNTQRVFESVVSIDAWRTTFDPKKGTSSVHVDVSFLKGKLGDEPEALFAWRSLFGEPSSSSLCPFQNHFELFNPV